MSSWGSRLYKNKNNVLSQELTPNHKYQESSNIPDCNESLQYRELADGAN